MKIVFTNSSDFTESNNVNLESFISYGNQITDLSPLLKLKSLSGLHLNGNDLSKVNNIEVISTLENSKHASFGLSGLVSIDFLEPLTNLESLELEANQITSREPIMKLVNLKYVNF